MYKLLFSRVDSSGPVIIKDGNHDFTPGEDNLFTLLDAENSREVSWVVKKEDEKHFSPITASLYFKNALVALQKTDV